MIHSTMLTAVAAVAITMALPAAPAQAQSIIQSLIGKVIGGEEETPAINYSERAPLVLPGSRDMRTPEAETAAVQDPNWPKDPDQKKKKKSTGSGGNTELLSQDELSTGSLPGVMQRRDGRTWNQANNDYEKMDRPVSPTKLRRKGTFGASSEPIVPGVEPERRSLVEPPRGYRIATAAVDPSQKLPSDLQAEQEKSAIQRIFDMQK
jgi:hypothetical protein